MFNDLRKITETSEYGFGRGGLDVRVLFQLITTLIQTKNKYLHMFYIARYQSQIWWLERAWIYYFNFYGY